jgi:hypothetical protein
MVGFFVSRDVVCGLEGAMLRVWLRARCVVVAAGLCGLAAGVLAGWAVLPAVPAAAQAAVAGVFVPAGPVRVLDTRDGTGAPAGPVGPGGTISLQIEGTDGVPASGVSAVVLNVTAVDPTTAGYVTVYPDGAERPVASNLNFTPGEVIANLVTVPVGADGAVDFYNFAGSVNLVADLAGYYTTTGTGSLLDSTGPVRVLDTRDGTGAPQAPVGPGGTISLPVDGVDGVPAAGVTAVVLNVTATDTTAASYVTVYPDGGTRPLASNLNFTAGETIPNLVVVPVGADGKVDFYNFAGSTDLVADLSGYYTAAGAGYTPLGPVRVLDTRNGTGAPQAPVGPGATITLQVDGVAGVPATGVTAVVLNVTATNPTAASYITVWPDGSTRPLASNLNVTAGETIPNLVVVPVGPDGDVDFYNNTGSLNLIADLAGYYTAGGAPWADATQIPGLTALNTGGDASVASLSCPSAGNCTAGGDYSGTPSAFAPNDQAFVADEVNGTWGNAQEVPGLAALNAGGIALMNGVSCGSAGNCAAVGSYLGSDGQEAFVADEVDGTWGDATAVPGISTLSPNGGSGASSVSCSSAGNCTLGGDYSDASGDFQAFVADEVSGTWGDAQEVPGTASLNTGGTATLSSVSCASAGTCAAGGYYTDSSGYQQAFVADETDSVWGEAQEVPGTAALNTDGFAGVSSLSCPSAGNCAAGGEYQDGSGFPQVFVADEVGGVWGQAFEVPGTAALNTVGSAYVFSVSCASAGNCSAGGDYDQDTNGPPPNSRAFVVSEVDGTWGGAIEVPGTATDAAVGSVSCPSAGNCIAGGSYADSSGAVQTFVISEENGIWGEAIQIPGTAALNIGGSAGVGAVSCPPTGSCTVGGSYASSSSASQAFVASQN